MGMANHLLTDSETARLLRLTPRQVARLARRGEIPSVTLPGNEVRFDPDDIREWVESLKESASAKFVRQLTGEPEPDLAEQAVFVQRLKRDSP